MANSSSPRPKIYKNCGNKKTSHSKEISHYFSLIVSNYKGECVIIATIHFGTKTTIGQINLENEVASFRKRLFYLTIYLEEFGLGLAFSEN